MTRDQFLEKVKILADNIHRDTLERAERILKSGAFDLDSLEDNYRLPKNFIVANARQTMDDYAPMRGSDKREITNIYRFI